jgi:spermidine synthase
MTDAKPSRIVARAQGRQGELALRAVGDHFEIISNGVFLMDTRNGESERLLVQLALRDRRPRSRVLIGGLGVGFSLAEALRSDLVERATVVEIEPKVIEWNRTWLASFSGSALADPRVEIVNDDLIAWLERDGAPFDAICLDIDNGPAWTVTEANGRLYSDAGLALLRRRLRPGGTLAVWSAARAEGFQTRLQLTFEKVEAVAVPAPRGEPDVVYVASRASEAVPSSTPSFSS